MWVWLVDSWTWGRSWTCSIPTLVPILFSPVSHPYISWNFFKIFLMCLFVYFFDGLWPLEMIWVCHHQHQHSFLHLCSFVCLVFHFRHTPRSREESWKATVWSTSSVSEPESLRWLDSWLFIKAKCILYLIEELHDAYTDNSGKKRSPVYDSTALTEISKEFYISHHVTVTGEQFALVSLVREQSSKQYSTQSIAVRT